MPVDVERYLKLPAMFIIAFDGVVLNQISEAPDTIKSPPILITGFWVVDNRSAWLFVLWIVRLPAMFRKYPFKSTKAVVCCGQLYTTCPKFCFQLSECAMLMYPCVRNPAISNVALLSHVAYGIKPNGPCR